MSEQIKVFSDHIGRVVAGVLVEETDTHLTVHNPVGIYAQPHPNGQIQTQVLPFIFADFLTAETRDKQHWTFPKASIAVSNVQLEDRLRDVVLQVNRAPAQPVPAEGDAKVISLFD